MAPAGCICRRVCWCAVAAPCRQTSSGAASAPARPRTRVPNGTTDQRQWPRSRWMAPSAGEYLRGLVHRRPSKEAHRSTIRRSFGSSPCPRRVAISGRGEPKHRADEACHKDIGSERHQTGIKRDAGAAEMERVQRLEIVHPGESCAAGKTHRPSGDEAMRPEPAGVEAENQGRKRCRIHNPPSNCRSSANGLAETKRPGARRPLRPARSFWRLSPRLLE